MFKCAYGLPPANLGAGVLPSCRESRSLRVEGPNNHPLRSDLDRSTRCAGLRRSREHVDEASLRVGGTRRAGPKVRTPPQGRRVRTRRWPPDHRRVARLTDEAVPPSRRTVAFPDESTPIRASPVIVAGPAAIALRDLNVFRLTGDSAAFDIHVATIGCARLLRVRVTVRERHAHGKDDHPT